MSMLNGARREEVTRILEDLLRNGEQTAAAIDAALAQIAATFADAIADNEAVNKGEPLEFYEFERRFCIGPDWQRDDDATFLRLLVAGMLVPVEIIAGWREEEVQQADLWALAEQFKGVDNDLIFPPRPSCLDGGVVFVGDVVMGTTVKEQA